MHHVNPRRRRAAILRFFAYGLTLTLSILTTVVLLYVALGYRLDSKNGQVIRSGLLLVDSKPEAAQVYLNNKLKDASVPSRFVLPIGDYSLSLKRAGYRQWQKTLTIGASQVEEIDYPLLLPTKITPKPITDLQVTNSVSQSLDRKLLLTYVPEPATLQLITLDPTQPKVTTLPLAASVSRENGSVGNFQVVEWATNNKQVLLQHTLPSGLSELLSIDVTKPAELINISKVYAGQIITEPHFDGSKTDQLYGVVDGALKRFTLKDGKSQTLLENVRSYMVYGDTTIAFARLNSTKNVIENGIWQADKATVINTYPNTESASLISYTNYSDHFYLAVAKSDGQKVIIYRDPLKKPILAEQLPFIQLTFEQAKRFKASASGQHLLIQTDTSLLSYNFEEFQKARFTLPFTLSSATSLDWVDNDHLLAIASDGSSHLLDFDGTNQLEVQPASANSQPYFANDYKHAFQLTMVDGVEKLEAASLVANKN